MEIKQTETFRIWESKLRDTRARTMNAEILFRLAKEWRD
jgi:putative component of toxin-antitoxin plasmid stabilization module